MKIRLQDMLEEILQNQYAILSALADMSEVPGDARRRCRHRSYVTEAWLDEHDMTLRQK